MGKCSASPKGAGQAAGGPLSIITGPHIPVMLKEVLAALRPAAGEIHLDGTFGAGGYSNAILASGADVIGIDRDPDAIANGKALVEKYAADKSTGKLTGKLTLVQGRFGELDTLAGEAGYALLDGVVLDIGVSSMQLDQGMRGFSFQKDGPLDMRMARSGVSAADVVNNADQATLTRVIGILGEEKKASRIARTIVDARKGKTFSRTLELANLIEKTIGRKPGERIHPATRVFQGLRIFVNQELEELSHGLFAAERILKPGGRLVVVTFHSLEDRIVKRFFADRVGGSGGSRHLPEVVQYEPSFTQKKRSAIAASPDEAESNPRARSAKMRVGVRTEAAAHLADLSIFGLPNLKLVTSPNE